MDRQKLIEYLIAEKKLRGVITWRKPTVHPVIKKYPLVEKYIRKPLWCIEGGTLDTTGIIIFKDVRGVYSPQKSILYEWLVQDYFPIKSFKSPLICSRPAPTISFECPHKLTEAIFIRQEAPTFAQFIAE